MDLLKFGKLFVRLVNREGVIKDGFVFYYIVDFVSLDSGFFDMEWEKDIDRLRREIFL